MKVIADTHSLNAKSVGVTGKDVLDPPYGADAPLPLRASVTSSRAGEVHFYTSRHSLLLSLASRVLERQGRTNITFVSQPGCRRDFRGNLESRVIDVVRPEQHVRIKISPGRRGGGRTDAEKTGNASATPIFQDDAERTGDTQSRHTL